jgi:hypothetical protein
MTGPKQPVSVAGIEFDALIESTEDYSASVPQYPIDEVIMWHWNRWG